MRLPLLGLLVLAAAPALAVGTEDAAPSVGAAQAEIDAGDYPAAIALLTEIVAGAPADADALNLLGYASRKSGALDAAAGYYEAALAAEPDHLGALEYQGELFLMQGDVVRAGANMERLTALCGDCPEARALMTAIDTGGW